MGNFSRNKRSGGGGYRGRDSRPRQMHKAVCDECGNDCEVPFRPSGDKPIYCSSCFEKKEGSRSGGSRKGSRDGGYRTRDNSKQIMEQFNTLNQKLDRILDSLNPEKNKEEKKKEIKKSVVKKKATEPVVEASKEE